MENKSRILCPTLVYPSLCVTLVLIISSSLISLTRSETAEQYLCSERSQKLVVDAWSIKDLLFLKLNHYRDGNASKEIDCRLFIYDQANHNVLNVYQIPQDHKFLLSSQFPNNSHALADVVAKIIANRNEDNSSPSILHFESRITLRNSCQNEWLYDPQNSQFCRRHPVPTNLGRVVAVVGQMVVSKPNHANLDLYRLTRVREDSFHQSTIRAMNLHLNIAQAKDTLSQYLTTSILLLQVTYPSTLPQHQAVRFMFSNKLGLFVSWFPTNFASFANDTPTNCAIMLSIKLQPYIKLCSHQHNFVSFLETESGIQVILDENRQITLSFDYLKKQFRIYNNLYIDLDQMPTFSLFDKILNCGQQIPLSKSLESVENFSQNSSDTVNNHTTERHSMAKRSLKGAVDLKAQVLGSFQAKNINSWWLIGIFCGFLVVGSTLFIILHIVEKEEPPIQAKLNASCLKPSDEKIAGSFNLPIEHLPGFKLLGKMNWSQDQGDSVSKSIKSSFIDNKSSKGSQKSTKTNSLSLRSEKLKTISSTNSTNTSKKSKVSENKSTSSKSVCTKAISGISNKTKVHRNPLIMQYNTMADEDQAKIVKAVEKDPSLIKKIIKNQHQMEEAKSRSSSMSRKK